MQPDASSHSSDKSDKTTAAPHGRFLATILLRPQSKLWSRFLTRYAHLRALPRGWQRRLGRKAAVSLAGAALLLALGRAPAAHAATITVVNGEVEINDNNRCSLIEAIINANNGAATYNDCKPGGAGADTIKLPANGVFTLTAAHGYYNGSNTGLPQITSDITIQGNGSTIRRDTADLDQFRILSVYHTAALTLNNVTISGGHSAADGGGIYINGGELTINNSTISDSTAQGRGGGIFSIDSQLTLSNSTIEDNYATDGGGIHIRYETASISGSTITNNTAGLYGSHYGGGLYNFAATVTITDSTFSDNTASRGGGAIYNEGDDNFLNKMGEVTINNSIFTGNKAGSEGGAIYNTHYGRLEIHHSTLTQNEVTGSGHGGGAVYSNGYVLLNYSTLHHNTSSIYGGAVNSDGGELHINRSVIRDNYAEYRGGGVFSSSTVVTITDSTISGNESGGFEGGGLFHRSYALTIIGSTISGNKAHLEGGGVFTRGNPTTITNSTISGNTTQEYGGGVYVDSGSITTITNSTITGNTAVNDDGGGLYNSGTIYLNRSIVSGNSAGNEGQEIANDQGDIYADNYNILGHGDVHSDDAFYDFTPGVSDFDASSDSTDNTALTAILNTTLASNGGPTQTHALPIGSPAIDFAPSAACTPAPTNGLDQRGAPRSVDGNGLGSGNECDAGAFERQGEHPAFFLSTDAPGNVAGVGAFDQSDILRFTDGTWSLFFDGSAAGLTAKHNLNAIHVNAADDIYLSFFENKIKTANLGNVFGHDILHYDGSGFSFFFDGSDVGLTTTAEKLDGLEVLDGSAAPDQFGGACSAYLLVSTFGTGKVPAFGGGNISFQGEDVLGFCATNTGEATSGFWTLVLDGSAEGMPKNSTFSLSAFPGGSQLYFTTAGAFNVGGASGSHSEMYQYDTITNEFSGPFFSAPANGLNQKVDGLHVAGDLP